MSRDLSDIEGFELLDKVVARALADKAYRDRLINNPRAVLREAKIKVDPGVEVVVHQNSRDTIHLVLPSSRGATRLKVEDKNIRIVDKFWPY